MSGPKPGGCEECGGSGYKGQLFRKMSSVQDLRGFGDEVAGRPTSEVWAKKQSIILITDN
ncbi:hypothetical protein THIOM_004699 [Candidatus Thiomargarita nelsonii]|uniref:Uncharacterized protein n=1 Tax=Candidatus Thiomargarita nelsonii TaxID=1003181 RepID=A0A176RVA7_9GAMM|nr:hypothetical protein THIOM_004699 [Candidatus Thiomargarita nelsonii]